MEKMLERFNALSIAEKVILIAGAVLFIDGFLPWYSVDVGPFSVSRNGWESPGAFWSMLAVLIGLAMTATIVLRSFTEVAIPENLSGVSWPRLYLGAGAASLVLVLIKLINENSYLGFGFYIGIVATAVLATAGFLMYREEGSTPTTS